MSVFITGVTGYVGKHLLRYSLNLTNRNIVVCIRGKNGISGINRFEKEIKHHPLFDSSLIQSNLKNVKVIEKDVESLEKSDVDECSDIIHCAANVKFTAPYDLLYAENVVALKNIYDICKAKRFLYISTCYVHPKITNPPYDPIKISPDLKRTDFIADYAYTKYLAEDYLYKQSGNIDIIRLSCVGAPIENLPPIRGGAHLSVMELLERRKIPDMWLPDTVNFSTVPVDFVCKGIIEKLKNKNEGLDIVQYAAPPESEIYNISAKDILNESIFPKTTFWRQDHEYFIKWMKAIYWILPSFLKAILDTSAIVSYVTKNQTFRTNLQLPELSKKEYNDLTTKYVKTFVKENPTKPKFVQDSIMYIFSLIKWVILKIKSFYE